MSTFTIDAYIAGARNRHHRTHDHTGFEVDSNVVISQPIGPYPSGTTLATVLAALDARLADLEASQFSTRLRSSFTMDCFIAHYFSVNAIVKRTQTSTFVLDAVLTRGGRYTIDAYIGGGGTFTVNALIV